MHVAIAMRIGGLPEGHNPKSRQGSHDLLAPRRFQRRQYGILAINSQPCPRRPHPEVRELVPGQADEEAAVAPSAGREPRPAGAAGKAAAGTVRAGPEPRWAGRGGLGN